MRLFSKLINFTVLATMLFGMAGVAYAQGAATILFSEGQYTKKVGDEFNVPVIIDPNSESLDTARVVIKFSPDIVSVTAFTLGDQFPEKSPGSSYDNTAGKVNWGGFNVSGPVKSRAVFGTITFKALKVGTSPLEVTTDSHLINSGEEKINFSALGSSKIVIEATKPPVLETPPPPAPPAATPTPEPTVVTPEPALPELQITSSSHPDQEKWYQSSDFTVSWNQPDGVDSFMTILSTDPERTPTHQVTYTSHTYKGLDEGVWYFAAAARMANGKLGPIARFRVQVDHSKPKPFIPIIEVLGLQEVQGFKDKQIAMRATFGAIDLVSGIDHYELTVNGEVTKTAQSPYTFHVSPTDKISVVADAVDKAGNVRESKAELAVNLDELPILPSAIPTPEPKPVPTDWWLIIREYWASSLLGLIAFIGLLALLFFLLGEKKCRDDKKRERRRAAAHHLTKK